MGGRGVRVGELDAGLTSSAPFDDVRKREALMCSVSILAWHNFGGLGWRWVRSPPVWSDVGVSYPSALHLVHRGQVLSLRECLVEQSLAAQLLRRLCPPCNPARGNLANRFAIYDAYLWGGYAARGGFQRARNVQIERVLEYIYRPICVARWSQRGALIK